ncbi:endonuclease III [bacterium BMS3Bbin06]|nr:endonuclease III [bacterium BMS3Abin08]GBE35337.1 endonuclease III [bacterium BMS3Bbin06]HDO36736.1 endonuclease III domain-containing protein [Nitrospirota bacterium]HDY71468.1 endonuclease III domain-containing protein [Nitrospirota bacterium]
MKELIPDIYKRLHTAFGPQHWWPGDGPFEVMVGAILTQNTNWGNVEKAINNLKASGVLDPLSIYKMDNSTLSGLIRPAGYYNIKAERLKAFVGYFTKGYSGQVGKMEKRKTEVLRKELLDIKGIGPETADSILLYALKRPVFVIDAYTKRVLSRHGILVGKADYNEFQELFHLVLPEDVVLFNEYHALFVRLGKELCRPKPRCDGCPLHPLLP